MVETTSTATHGLDGPSRFRFVMVAILMLIVFIAFFDRVNISILIANDQFLTDMGIKGEHLKIGMLMSVFLFTYGIANVAVSPLGDLLGPRKMTLLASGLWIVSMIVGGISGTFTMMIAARIMLGIGEGSQYPCQGRFVKNWFPPMERGRTNACWLIGVSLGQAAAMPFFAMVIASWGWRPSFFICALLGLIPLAVVAYFASDTPAQSKYVNAKELAYIQAGQQNEVIETEQASFKDNVKAFLTNYRFWLVVLWAACMSIILWGLVTWLPTYLKTVRGFSWKTMGFLASLPFLLGIVAKIIGGWMADKLGRCAPFCSIAMLLAALSIYFGATSTSDIASALLLAFGQGFLLLGSPSMWSLTQGFVPGKAMTTAGGVMNGVAILFGSLSPMIIGFFVNSSGSYVGGLLFLVATAVVGMLGSLILVYQKY